MSLMHNRIRPGRLLRSPMYVMHNCKKRWAGFPIWAIEQVYGTVVYF